MSSCGRATLSGSTVCESIAWCKANTAWLLTADALNVYQACCANWYRCMTEESQIKRIEAVHKTPVMFYRPNQPSGGSYLKVPFSHHIRTWWQAQCVLYTLNHTVSHSIGTQHVAKKWLLTSLQNTAFPGSMLRRAAREIAHCLAFPVSSHPSR